jgi:hypothetical protein
MILLMVLWTAVLVVDLAQGLLSIGGIVAVGADEPAGEWVRRIALGVWYDLWSLKAQARAIVWGIPMIVFALITALTQR